MREVRLPPSSLLRAAASRRRFLAGTAAAAAGAALLAACSSDDAPSSAITEDPNATPVPGGTLRSALPFDPDNLDPAQGGFAFPVFQRMYSYLHHIDGRTLEVIPDLAAGYEQVDELTYVFHLKSGVKFQDISPVNGREVTAEDVAYSFGRLTEVLNPIDPGFMTRVVDRVEAVDATTLRISTKRPYASTMQVLGGFWYAVVPREAVEEFGGLSNNGIGSGPFILDTFEQEAGATLRRNPGYAGTPRPYLDGMEITVISDQNNALSQFRAKALDVNPIGLDKIRFDDLRSELDGVRSSKVPGILDPWVGVNLRRPPFNDQRVRAALDMAIDRRAMIQTLAFGDGRLNGPIPWGNERWALPNDELELFYVHDPAEARSMLDAAGVGPLKITHRVTTALPYGEEIGTILKEQLRPLDIDVTIEVHEQNDWIQTVILNQNFDTCGFAWFPVLDPTVSLRFLDKDDIFSGLMFGFDDPAITALYSRMQEQFDVTARREATFDLQRAALDFHGPVLHMFDPYQYNLWWPWLHNWKPENTELNFYSDEHWLSPRT